jgi:hypothetical protein
MLTSAHRLAGPACGQTHAEGLRASARRLRVSGAPWQPAATNATGRRRQRGGDKCARAGEGRSPPHVSSTSQHAYIRTLRACARRRGDRGLVAHHGGRPPPRRPGVDLPEPSWPRQSARRQDRPVGPTAPRRCTAAHAADPAPARIAGRAQLRAARRAAARALVAGAA